MVSVAKTQDYYHIGLRTPINVEKWKSSAYGEYLEYIWGIRERIKNSNVLYFDIEFFPSSLYNPKFRVAIYHETKPPKGKRKNNIVWHDDIHGIEAFIRDLKRADYIVAYNPMSLDYPSLKRYGLDHRDVLLKTIDLYEFVFKVISWKGSGSLSEVSILNGGLGKVQRKDNSSSEYQRQCDRDVKALKVLFKKILEGRFQSSKYGELDLEGLFNIPQAKVLQQPTSKSQDEFVFGRLDILPTLGFFPPLHFRYQRHTVSPTGLGVSP